MKTDATPRSCCRSMKQVEDLRLNAHVERAHGFICDDEFGFARERRCDSDALALSARQMGRQAPGQCGIEAHTVEQVTRTALPVGRGADTVAVERFAHAAPNRPARIEAAIGALEHRLHPTAEVR